MATNLKESLFSKRLIHTETGGEAVNKLIRANWKLLIVIKESEKIC